MRPAKYFLWFLLVSQALVWAGFALGFYCGKLDALTKQLEATRATTSVH